jgi:hypothetical protein
LLLQTGPGRAEPVEDVDVITQDPALSPSETTLSHLPIGGENHLFMLTDDLDYVRAEKRPNIIGFSDDAHWDENDNSEEMSEISDGQEN